MCATFAAEFEGAVARGRFSVVGLWTVTVLHFLMLAPVEWLSHLRRSFASRQPAGDSQRTTLGSRPSLQNPLRGVGADLKIAVRTVRRQPGYTALVVATLAFGIGATTGIFSLVNAFLFAPLPFADAARLVSLRDVISRPGQADWWYTPTPRSFFQIRENFPLLEDVAGQAYRTVSVTGQLDPAQVVGVAVSDRWLEALGVDPVLGRGFSPVEQALGDQARVVLLGHGFWTSRLGADTSVLDGSILLDGAPYTPIGVMPQGFRYPWGGELWFPGTFDRNSGIFGLNSIGRMASGVTPETLEQALIEFSEEVAAAFPDTHRDIRFGFFSMRRQLFGNRPGVGLVLLGSVALLLLIACANVAGLALVRVLSRNQEMAIRGTLGSSRWRSFRLVFLEGAMMSAAGGAIGLWLAYLIQGTFGGASGGRESGLWQVTDSINVDARVAMFAAAATGLAMLITGLAPAVRASWPNRGSLLESGGRGGMSGKSKHLLAMVVVSESGFAVALLIAATLVLHAYSALATVDRGYDAVDRYALRISMPQRRFPEGDDRLRTLRRIVDRLEAEPGVLAAGYAHHLPVTPGDWTRAYSIENGVASGPGRRILANIRWIGPSYFDALGMRMDRGRTFSPDEMSRAADVVILSSHLARLHWPDDDPIGKRFKIGELGDDNRWLEVVGVVAQAQEEWAFLETFYLPYTHRPFDWVELVIHATPSVTRDAIRTAIREIDVLQPAEDLRPLAQLQVDDLRSDRTSALIMSLFGIAGLALSVLGTYGVVSYSVRQRSREIGIRLALGSPSSAVMLLILREGGTWLGAGVAIGVVGALGTLTLVSTRLSAVGESVQVQLLAQGLNVQPFALMGVMLAVCTTGTLACLVPARRVLQNDPVRSLQQQ